MFVLLFTDQIVPESPYKLGRQPTIVFRAPMSNQNSIEEQHHTEIQYENEGKVLDFHKKF